MGIVRHSVVIESQKMKLFALIAATADFGPFDQCAGDGVSNGAEFSEDPFTWVGADLGKPKLHGAHSMKMLINMNGLKNFGGKNLNYIGMSIWSRKKCGPDFLDILDKYDEGNPAGWYQT